MGVVISINRISANWEELLFLQFFIWYILAPESSTFTLDLINTKPGRTPGALDFLREISRETKQDIEVIVHQTGREESGEAPCQAPKTLVFTTCNVLARSTIEDLEGTRTTNKG